jgi:hypothetical protein
MTERCEGITASGEQCRCWAVEKINEVPYCDQHAAKELRAIAGDDEARRLGRASGAAGGGTPSGGRTTGLAGIVAGLKEAEEMDKRDAEKKE